MEQWLRVLGLRLHRVRGWLALVLQLLLPALAQLEVVPPFYSGRIKRGLMPEPIQPMDVPADEDPPVAVVVDRVEALKNVAEKVTNAGTDVINGAITAGSAAFAAAAGGAEKLKSVDVMDAMGEGVVTTVAHAIEVGTIGSELVTDASHAIASEVDAAKSKVAEMWKGEMGFW